MENPASYAALQPKTDTMNLIWSAKAKEIIAAPLAQAIEAGTIKHIDDFVFLRIGCPQPETQKEQSGEQ